MPERLLGQLEATLAELGVLGKRLTVAYSGGVDSTVLLHLMASLGARVASELNAVHVNHQISPNASRWGAHCQAVCEQLQIPLQVFSVTVDVSLGEGLEAAARRGRYGVFEGLDTDVVLLAHHAQDQAETLLLNLVRGAGLRGVAGMPPRRQLTPTIALARPLLEVTKAVIDEYAKRSGLSWIEDESNFNRDLSRNRLRHDVLPVLAAINSGWESHFSFAAKDAAITVQQQEWYWRNQLARVQVNDCLSCEALLPMPDYDRAQLIRLWLRGYGVNPGRAQLEQVLAILEARGDAMPRVHLGKRVILRYRDLLYCEDEMAVSHWQGGVEVHLHLGRIEIPGGVLLVEEAEVGVSRSLLGSRLSLRPRQGGERLRPANGAARQCLKKLAQAQGVPVWLRNNRPYLYLADRLVAVPGLWVDADYQSTGQAMGLKLTWMPVASGRFD